MDMVDTDDMMVKVEILNLVNMANMGKNINGLDKDDIVNLMMKILRAKPTRTNSANSCNQTIHIKPILTFKIKPYYQNK